MYEDLDRNELVAIAEQRRAEYEDAMNKVNELRDRAACER